MHPRLAPRPRDILLAFEVQDHTLGGCPSFANALRRWPHWFAFAPERVRCTATPDTAQGRTAALAQVTQALATEGMIAGWRDEKVSVSHHYARRSCRASSAPRRAPSAWSRTGPTSRGSRAATAKRTCGSRAARPPRAWTPTGSTTSWAGASPRASRSETILKKPGEAGAAARDASRGVPAWAPCAWSIPCPRACTARSSSGHDLWLPEDFTPEEHRRRSLGALLPEHSGDDRGPARGRVHARRRHRHGGRAPAPRRRRAGGPAVPGPRASPRSRGRPRARARRHRRVHPRELELPAQEKRRRTRSRRPHLHRLARDLRPGRGLR
ncbi:MAG: DUF4743 domain-containing protein [Betaproteobacteria bacterium]|nr:DUF4743 domain-containing protein [Betaproteobacteria bacterium]